jgi:4-diphosphocytidyl-2-C-methyl-D-erythritol kinase
MSLDSSFSLPDLTLRAPAKFNHVLEVGPCRPAGLHAVLTLIRRLELADTLDFYRLDSEGLTLEVVNAPGLPADERNMVIRAGRRLAEEVRRRGETPSGMHIRLTKNIPVSAGLGGGSSDAAATLVALNALWRAHLDHAVLLELAARLGSDVPAFLGPPNAWYGGRGERLLRRVRLPACGVLLLAPEAGLSTAEVYRRLDEARRNVELPVEPVAEVLPEDLPAPRNTLAAVARRLVPELDQWLKHLRTDAEVEAAEVSGSGPTLFALCADRAAAERVRARLAFTPHWSTVTQTAPG